MRTAAFVQGAGRGLGLAFAHALLERGKLDLVFASAREPARSAGLAALECAHPGVLRPLAVDVTDEPSIVRAAEAVRASGARLDLALCCAGVLHDGDALRPEKRLADVDPAQLQRAFAVNAIGPLLVAKHFAPLLQHGERAILATLSARVGSIGDNRLGGWYAYRASKAAQNMFVKSLSLELRRRTPSLMCVALHPGTVDTDLSRPFRSGLPAAQLFSPERAAAQLLDVLERVGPEDSGSFLDWRGQPVPW